LDPPNASPQQESGGAGVSAAWRKGGENALWLGDGSGARTLSTRGTAEAPMVAIFSAKGALLGTRLGRISKGDVVRVEWGEQVLRAEYVEPKDRHEKTPNARYRATVPEREES
jgi:hypothetical protein